MSQNPETPLAKKLGMDTAQRTGVVNPPVGYEELIGFSVPLETSIRFKEYASGVLHVFATEKKFLQNELPLLKDAVFPGGTLWISWPKQSASVETDLTEGIIRELGLAAGLVDVKVCAVNEIWSGLKLVHRRENRKV